MTHSKAIVALAAAVSLGIVQHTNTPTAHEVPLSKSDIVIAEKGQTTGAEGSAKIGEGSEAGGAADQNSAAPPGSAPPSEGG
jgi:hypothetical protein